MNAPAKQIPLPYRISSDAISVYFNGQMKLVSKTDSRYEDVANAIRNENYDEVANLLDVKGKLISETNGGLYLMNGCLRAGAGFVVPPMLTERILHMVREGFSIDRLAKFLEKVHSNPISTAMPELYGFLDKCDLPICEDGDFLAYKMVDSNFKDLWTHTMDNSVGAIVEMDRDKVDTDCTRGCSTGLHFCSVSYLSGYGSRDRGDVVIVLKINPADVMSIPKEYHLDKGRACRYEVIDTIEWDTLIPPLVVNVSNDSPDFELTPDKELSPESTDDNSTRWEVRDSGTKLVVATFGSRKDARKYRTYNPDTFLWDTLKEKIVAGRTDPNFNANVAASLEPDTEDEADKGTDRWELRGNSIGEFRYSVSSRTIAREIRKNDEFVYDTKLDKVEAGKAPSNSGWKALLD